MKQRKLTSLLFTFLLVILLITSCKKDSSVKAVSDNQVEVTERIKTVSVGANGIASITTTKGSHYTQDVTVRSSKTLSTSSISPSGDSTVVFLLPVQMPGPKSGGPTTNLVQPGFQPITAYITYSGGYAIVTLSSYSQSYNGITQTATVFGVVSDSSGGSFFVQYVRSNGDSFSIEYYFHFSS